jgi:hypothetical protein
VDDNDFDEVMKAVLDYRLHYHDGNAVFTLTKDQIRAIADRSWKMGKAEGYDRGRDQ